MAVSAGAVDLYTKTHTNLGGCFNWCLESLGDRDAHSTEKEGAETGSQVIWLSGSHPHKDQQSETLWIKSFTASVAGPGKALAVGGTVCHYQGSPPLLLRQSATTKAVHTAAGQSLQQLSNTSAGRL